jgi:hypothetical protein
MHISARQCNPASTTTRISNKKLGAMMFGSMDLLAYPLLQPILFHKENRRVVLEKTWQFSCIVSLSPFPRIAYNM